jgi:hypothetical protein
MHGGRMEGIGCNAIALICSKVLHDIEKLLTLWMEDQNQRQKPLSSMTIKDKVCAYLKEKKGK